MSNIRKYLFNNDVISELEKAENIKNWPVVYILENGKEVYIGETTNVIRRFKQHLDNKKRKVLKNASIISDNDFNKSVTLDLESLLIEYMAADTKMFRLQNSNRGIRNHNYYERERYRGKFYEIWS